jgi:uncharacterized protein YbjT (DUF2867 family)
MNIKNVCILGGTGFVGRHIAHLLTEQGICVHVPTRRRENAKALFVLPTVEIVEANIHAPDELKHLFEGMDAVINLVGILHEEKRGRVDKPSARRGDFHETHVELPRKIVHACADVGIKRLLHMSALQASPTAPSAYLRSKGLGEVIVREAGMARDSSERGYLDGPKFLPGYGLHTTVFRPSVIFGRDDSFLNMFAQLIKLFPLIPLADSGAKFQPVFVEDVAHAFVDSLNNPATYGQVYDLCGPEVYTLRGIVEFVAATLGRHPKIIPLGKFLSHAQAAVFEHLPGKKIMTRDNHYSMQVDNVCNCDFPAIFGFQPTAMGAVVPAYMADATPRGQYDGFRRDAHR